MVCTLGNGPSFSADLWDGWAISQSTDQENVVRNTFTIYWVQKEREDFSSNTLSDLDFTNSKKWLGNLTNNMPKTSLMWLCCRLKWYLV